MVIVGASYRKDIYTQYSAIDVSPKGLVRRWHVYKNLQTFKARHQSMYPAGLHHDTIETHAQDKPEACRGQACTRPKHAHDRHRTCRQSHAHARAETTKRMHTTTMKHHPSTQQVSAHIPLPTSTKSIPPSPTAVPACRHALTHSTAICNGKQGTHGK
jgi:hypothetical protein